MSEVEIPKCPHCGNSMDKWELPADSTWSDEFHWVCFNDACAYFVRGWDHMMNTQNVKASYRCKMVPSTGITGPLPCWSVDAHKARILKN